MLVGAIFKGEKIRYSSARSQAMIETFEHCVAIVGDPDNPKHFRYIEQYGDEKRAAELNARCKPRISFINGHLSIAFEGGGVIFFQCRTKDAGRGETGDINIFDEAQTLTESQLSDIMPNVAAATSGNPQTIFLGTPPELDRETGEAFFNIRSSAITGAKRTCWHEWSVDEIGDVSDRKRWYACNPSLGKSLIEDEIEKNFNTLSAVIFAIEHLCFWPTAASPYAINKEQWDETALSPEEYDAAGLSPDKVVKKCLGVKFDPDGLQVCVGQAYLMDNNKTHAELLYEGDTITGIQQIEDMIFDKREELAFVALDGRTGAGEMYERLMKRKNQKGRSAFVKQQIHLMRVPDVQTAATMVVNGLAEKTFTHTRNDVLDTSAKGAERRKIGQDGYGFGNNSCAIEAVAAANWAVKTTKRNARTTRKWKK
jgi:hypothetical protein